MVRSDIIPPQVTSFNLTLPCGKRKKTCHLINQTTKLFNSTNGRSFTIKSGGTCKSKNIVYAARCKVHDLIYVGHTGDELSQRFSKHRYDSNKRPDNNELSKHIARYNHNFETDIDITVLNVNSLKTNSFVYWELNHPMVSMWISIASGRKCTRPSRSYWIHYIDTDVTTLSL